MKMDLAARQVIVDGDEVTLANKEFELLRVLIQRAGQVVTREEILDEVWGGPELKTQQDPRHAHVVAAPQARRTAAARIATVRGVGFRFNAE